MFSGGDTHYLGEKGLLVISATDYQITPSNCLTSLCQIAAVNKD